MRGCPLSRRSRQGPERGRRSTDSDTRVPGTFPACRGGVRRHCSISRRMAGGCCDQREWPGFLVPDKRRREARNPRSAHATGIYTAHSRRPGAWAYQVALERARLRTRQTGRFTARRYPQPCSGRLNGQHDDSAPDCPQPGIADRAIDIHVRSSTALPAAADREGPTMTAATTHAAGCHATLIRRDPDCCGPAP